MAAGDFIPYSVVAKKISKTYNRFLDNINFDFAPDKEEAKKTQPKGRYFEAYPVKQVLPDDSALPQQGGYTIPSKSTDTMWLNPFSERNKFGTFEHEKQHLLDKLRANESVYPLDPLRFNISNNDILVDNSPEKQAIIDRTTESIKNAYKKYHDKYRLSNDFLDSGIIASLRSIEKTLPVGKGIMDTDIGQELFANNPDFLNTYYYRTRPEYTTYMQAPRDTASEKSINIDNNSMDNKSNLEKIQEYFRNVTTY